MKILRIYLKNEQITLMRCSLSKIICTIATVIEIGITSIKNFLTLGKNRNTNSRTFDKNLLHIYTTKIVMIFIIIPLNISLKFIKEYLINNFTIFWVRKYRGLRDLGISALIRFSQSFISISTIRKLLELYQANINFLA